MAGKKSFGKPFPKGKDEKGGKAEGKKHEKGESKKFERKEKD